MFKWLKDAKRLPEVERKLEAAEVDAENHKKAAIDAYAREATAVQALHVERGKVSELEKKVRQQNEADLLLVSLQIVQRITADEKKETSPGLQSLLDHQAALSSRYQQQGPYGSGNLLGALGLGGILGQWPH